MIFIKRVFLVVLDSVGIGAMPDAIFYGDEEANTLLSVSKSSRFFAPNFRNLGLFNIDSVEIGPKCAAPLASFARLAEASKGKDTMTGHFEISGIKVEKPFDVFSEGFPFTIMRRFEKATGHKTVCNKPYSGIKVLGDFGPWHQKTKDLIVYTSADSVFQIAAHEDVIPKEELYRCCAVAREILDEETNVARVIARPFTGEFPNYKRSLERRDFSVLPPKKTMLDYLKAGKKEVISVGKIKDIFSGKGITRHTYTSSNQSGIDTTLEFLKEDFEGLCFVNLIDFDMLYGHRNDVDGYAKALSYLDEKLPKIIDSLKKEDILMITADHGCDPLTPSTDHSREYVPILILGPPIKSGVNLGTRKTFSDVGKTILDYFDIDSKIDGESFLNLIKRNEIYEKV